MVNPEIPAKTAAFSLNNLSGEDCGVIEIGPGFGALTVELCKIYKKVAAIEIDEKFGRYLNAALDRGNLEIIFGDFLKTDLKALTAREFPGIKHITVCANLPYYITKPAILKIIREPFDAVTVMVQKEAADKLRAKPGDADYCEISALVSYFGEAEKLFDAPRSDFYPQPSVVSSVVRIIPRRTCAPENESLFFKIIAAAFGQRRKTFVNAVSSSLGANKEKVSETVKEITGNANIRGEELDIKTFSDISDKLNAL